MAPPSPELQKKIDNSKRIIKEKRNLDTFHNIHPDQYLDSSTLEKLENIKPWEFKTDVKQKREKYNKSNKPENLLNQEIFYAPTSHTPKVLVICIDFSDEPATLPLMSIADRFNLKTSETLSLYRYFNDISLGKHIPIFRIHGWYRMPKTKEYYANGEFGGGYKGITELTNDVLTLVLNDPIISWCSFDNDNDNTIDYIFMITSGYGAETTGNVNDLWSYAYGIPIKLPRLCNEVYISTNMFTRCSEYSLGYNPTGVYCHEYAHMLGAEDMHDYNKNTVGAGSWSLMGNGNYLDGGNTPCNIDAYNREKIEFATPGINITGYNLIRDSLITDIIYKYTTPIQNEYYLIENRQKNGWDTYIPGSGILIWHVSKDCKIYPTSTYNAYLMQADGKNDLGPNKTNTGDYGDPYPNSLTNNRTFNKTSNPNNLLCGSTTSYLRYDITNISNSSTDMLFYVTTDIIPCEPSICNFTIIQG